jgi:uncharacterized protein
MTYLESKYGEWIATLLLVVGGINWGMIGLFNFDMVAFLFGQQSILSRIIYVVIGIGALYWLYITAKVSEGMEPRLA